MPEHRFVAIGTLSKAGPMGRIVRMVIGLAMAAWVIWKLRTHEVLTGMEFPASGIWIGVLIMFYFLSDVFNIGFNRRWGRWPQYSFVLLVAGAILIDFAQYGGFWGPPVGWLIHLMMVGVGGIIALSFLLSAILASPG